METKTLRRISAAAFLVGASRPARWTLIHSAAIAGFVSEAPLQFWTHRTLLKLAGSIVIKNKQFPRPAKLSTLHHQHALDAGPRPQIHRLRQHGRESARTA